MEFYATNPLLKQIARDEEKELEDDISGDKRLVLSFKRAVRRKDVQIIFKWNVIHAILASLLIIIISYTYYSFQYNFILGIKEIGFSNSSFPDESNCHISERKDFFTKLEDTITCKLLLNRFYRINQILIWYYFLILFILIIISLLQFIALADYEDVRLDRLAVLLPQIDKDLLEPFAIDRRSYFVLEERYSKMGKKNFQKVVKLLIDEGYRLDLALRNVTFI